MKHRNARRLSQSCAGAHSPIVVRPTWLLGKLATMAALVLLIAAVHAPAVAQDPAPAPAPTPPAVPKYESLPVAQELLDDTRLRLETTATVRDILNGDVGLLGQEALFDAFYTRYVFAKMTQTDDASLAVIAKDRQKLLTDLSRTKSTDAHKRLVDLALSTMTTVVKGNFHPAVRYNAMLIIGELNSQEMVLIGEQAPPVPSLPALKVMLDELKNPDQIDAVRAAAMVGILRHAEYDGQRPDTQRMPADARKFVRDDMLALLAATDPPPGRSPEGHQWLQRRAVEVLGALGEVGDGGNVLTALLAILDDAAAPISYRCEAAIALGRLQYPQGFAIDPAVMAQKMGDLATQIARDEAALLEELLLEVDIESLQGTGRRGSGNQPGRSAYGPTPGAGQPSGTTVLRDGPLTSGSSKSNKSSGSTSGSSGSQGRRGSQSGGGSTQGYGGSSPSASGSYGGSSSGSSGSYGGSSGSYGSGYGGASGQSGRSQGDPQIARTLDIIRRRLAYRMYSLKLGLNGSGRDPGAFVALADAEKKPFVDDVHKGVVDLLNVAADDRLKLDKLNDELLASVRKLEAVVKVANREDEGDAPEDVPGAGVLPRGDVPGGDLPGGDVPGNDGPAGGDAPEVGDVVPGAEGNAVDLDLP